MMMTQLFPRRLARVIGSLFLVLLATGATWAQSWQWAQGPRPSTTGSSQGNRTVIDAAGNTYVTGFFDGTITFGSTTLVSTGDNDLFLVKLTSQGTYQWAIQAGGTGNDHAVGLAVDAAGNLVVSGYYYSPTIAFGATTLTNSSSNQGDIFVAKLDSSGTWQWARGAGGNSYEDASSVAVDSATGQVTIVGRFNSTNAHFGPITLTNPNLADQDAFIAALSASGTWLWAVRAGGTGSEDARYVAIDRSGNAFVTGTFGWQNARFGTTTLTSLGAADVYVAKLSPAGAWQWAVRGGSDGNDFVKGIVATPGGGAALQGYSYSGTGHFGATTLPDLGASAYMFVAELTAAGAWQRAQRTPDIYAAGMAQAPNGDLVMMGSFADPLQLGATQLTSAGSDDLFVARLTPAGTWAWAVSAGGRGDEQGYALAVDNRGEIAITGRYTSDTITFGTSSLIRPTPFDNVFIAHLGIVTGTPAETAPPAPFTLSPNPAHHTVHLSHAPSPTATILDATGRVVRTSDLSLPTADLDLKGLTPGLYLVRCGPATRRLVVE